MLNQIVNDILISSIIKRAAELTPVQKKVIEACEPLLVAIIDRAKKYFERIIKEFSEATKNTKVTYDFIKDFVKQNYEHDPEILTFLSHLWTTEQHSYRHDDPRNYNESAKQSYFKRLEQDTREFNLHKLTLVIKKYVNEEFVEVKNINVRSGTKGFEVTANLIDNQNRTWFFDAHAIPAGGYNIQIFHYRYIVHLTSSEVPKDYIRHRITEEEKSEKEKKIQERSLKQEQKRKDEKAKLVVRIVYNIKREIKDWYEWKLDAKMKQLQGGHSVGPLDWPKITQEEFDKSKNHIVKYEKFINDHFKNMKRDQIFEWALANNISHEFFDQLIMIGENDYDMRQLKRLS